MKSMALALLLLFACLLSARPAHADTPTQVAVAANFTKPAQEIAAAFSAETGHSLQLIFGASGALTQQIKAGAPFQLFLSADLENPKALIAAGQGVLGSAFTYAIGRLALFSPRPDLFDSAGRAGGRLILDQTAQCPGPGCFDHLAIANPETAPYGQAAMAVITAMGLTDRLAGKIVKMGNITACYASVQGGAAPIGFVAVSQVIDNDTGNMRPGQSVWVVPKTLHPPIEQGAVLLQNGAANPVARDFLAYLRQDRAQAIMRRYGYDIPGP